MNERSGWAIYLRKSRERMDTDDTLKRHRELCLDEAKKRGFTIQGVYEEIVSGGSGIDRRPEFSKIIKLLYEHQLDGLMVVDLDRLTRISSEQEQVFGTLDFTNTKLYLVSEHSFVDPQADKRKYKLLGILADFELDIIKERYRRGRQGALAEGRYIGSKPPYGYTRIIRSLGDGKREKLLVPHPDEAPVVQQIFQWRLEGLGIHTITRKLTEMGVPTRTGKSFWSKATVGSILGNPVYMGKIRTGQFTETISTLDGKHTRTTKDLKIIEGKHPPLVSKEDFEKVKGMGQHTWYSDRRGKNNPLAGLLYCKKCGYVVRISTKKKNSHGYHSPRYEHSVSGELPDGTLCPYRSRGFRADVILELIATHLEATLQDIQLEVSDTEVVERTAKEIETKRLELKKLEKKKVDIVEAIADERVHAIVEDSGVHKAVIDALTQRASQTALRMDALRADIERLEKAMPQDTEPYQLTLKEAIASLRDPSTDASALNLLLKSFIKRIEIDFEKSLEKNDSKSAKNRIPYLEITYLGAQEDPEQEEKYIHKMTKKTVR